MASAWIRSEIQQLYSVHTAEVEMAAKLVFVVRDERVAGSR